MEKYINVINHNKCVCTVETIPGIAIELVDILYKNNIKYIYEIPLNKYFDYTKIGDELDDPRGSSDGIINHLFETLFSKESTMCSTISKFIANELLKEEIIKNDKLNIKVIELINNLYNLNKEKKLNIDFFKTYILDNDNDVILKSRCYNNLMSSSYIIILLERLITNTIQYLDSKEDKDNITSTFKELDDLYRKYEENNMTSINLFKPILSKVYIRFDNNMITEDMFDNFNKLHILLKNKLLNK